MLSTSSKYSFGAFKFTAATLRSGTFRSAFRSSFSLIHCPSDQIYLVLVGSRKAARNRPNREQLRFQTDPLPNLAGAQVWRIPSDCAPGMPAAAPDHPPSRGAVHFAAAVMREHIEPRHPPTSPKARRLLYPSTPRSRCRVPGTDARMKGRLRVLDSLRGNIVSGPRGASNVAAQLHDPSSLSD